MVIIVLGLVGRIAELAAVGGRGGWIMVLPVIASFDIVQYLTWALLLVLNLCGIGFHISLWYSMVKI